jgi:hypothetical protein
MLEPKRRTSVDYEKCSFGAVVRKAMLGVIELFLLVDYCKNLLFFLFGGEVFFDAPIRYEIVSASDERG